jgi:hypothetical protein
LVLVSPLLISVATLFFGLPSLLILILPALLVFLSSLPSFVAGLRLVPFPRAILLLGVRDRGDRQQRGHRQGDKSYKAADVFAIHKFLLLCLGREN